MGKARVVLAAARFLAPATRLVAGLFVAAVHRSAPTSAAKRWPSRWRAGTRSAPPWWSGQADGAAVAADAAVHPEPVDAEPSAGALDQRAKGPPVAGSSGCVVSVKQGPRVPEPSARRWARWAATDLGGARGQRHLGGAVSVHEGLVVGFGAGLERPVGADEPGRHLAAEAAEAEVAAVLIDVAAQQVVVAVGSGIEVSSTSSCCAPPATCCPTPTTASRRSLSSSASRSAPSTTTSPTSRNCGPGRGRPRPVPTAFVRFAGCTAGSGPQPARRTSAARRRRLRT